MGLPKSVAVEDISKGRQFLFLVDEFRNTGVPFKKLLTGPYYTSASMFGHF